MSKHALVLNEITNLKKIKIFWKKKKGIAAIVLSGSACYGEYKKNWSDIDLTIIVKNSEYYSKYYETAKKMRVYLMTIEKYNEEIKRQSPLSVFLSQGVWLYTSPKSIFKYNFVVDSRYIPIMFWDSVVAFRLAKFRKSYGKKIRQVYHAIRYILRGLCLTYFKTFPVSEKDCINYSWELLRISKDISPNQNKFIIKTVKLYIDCLITKYSKNYNSSIFETLKNQFLALSKK